MRWKKLQIFAFIFILLHVNFLVSCGWGVSSKTTAIKSSPTQEYTFLQLSSNTLDEEELIVGGRSRSNVGFLNDTTFHYEVNDSLVGIYSIHGRLIHLISFGELGIEAAIIKDATSKFPDRQYEFEMRSIIGTHSLPRNTILSYTQTKG